MLPSLLQGITLTAPAMIVTIYGDIVVPRGGVLWIGNLIEICAQFSITETQVRTAVSRLVSAGRLIGIRDGRRSYYQLAESAREEFDLAARLLFEQIQPATGWTLLHTRASAQDSQKGKHFGALGSGLFIRPDHDHYPQPSDGITFRASLTQGREEMLALVHSLWPLDAYAAEYRSFIDRFTSLVDRSQKLNPIDGRNAVFFRLLLVHLYRHVLLADPLLPSEMMPADWPGEKARTLFAKAYLELSEHADRAIGDWLEGRSAPLPAKTQETMRRLEGVRAVAGLAT
ncbi:PaaX family transcriptional regulator [Agrobacterium vitis]|nr:PaaX family transcriptional regulator [Agrobacterium vitis]